MMTKNQSVERPSIHMIDTEAEALADMAIHAADRLPQVSALLLAEIERATMHSRDTIGPDVVTMGARVGFIDEASGADRTVQLVYPGQADFDAGRLSIMTPVGAGLIGLRTGQSILWPDRSGHERRLTIVGVQQQTPVEPR